MKKQNRHMFKPIRRIVDSRGRNATKSFRDAFSNLCFTTPSPECYRFLPKHALRQRNGVGDDFSTFISWTWHSKYRLVLSTGGGDLGYEDHFTRTIQSVALHRLAASVSRDFTSFDLLNCQARMESRLLL